MSALHLLWHSSLVAALGWTLLHTLWQGLIVAVVLAMILGALRRRSAAARYVAASAAMLAVFALAVATFIRLNHAMQLASASGAPGAPGVWNFSGESPAVPAATSPAVSPVTHLNNAVPLLALAWAAGVLILGIRQLTGWLGVQSIRRTATPISDDRVLAIFAELIDRIGIRQFVCLAQSSVIQVPTMIGWIRPMVLLPVAVLTGLSPQQLRGLLAHELAHVRRYDYLANLLQAAIETLMFYHPAAWWIGRRIRQEREHCCDDVAAKLSDRAVFAKALAGMEHLRQTSAPAVSVRGGDLLSRIRRLLLPDEKSSSLRWSWVTPAALLLVILLSTASLQRRAHAGNATQPNQGLCYVSGVPRSGAYEIFEKTGRVISMQHLFNATGFNQDPARKTLILIRRDDQDVETRQTLDMQKIMSGSPGLPGLQDGDVLMVEDKPPQPSGVYYVAGDDVPLTGVYSLMNRRISLLQAMVAAGVDPLKIQADQVMVIRVRSGKTQAYRFDVNQLSAGSDAPFILEERDAVIVSHKKGDVAAHVVRLVVGPDEVTLEGTRVELPALQDTLKSLPDPANTALEFACETDTPGYRRYEVMDTVADLVGQLGMKYLIDIGNRSLGSRAADN
jgi:beta-lactamase regulating signal transducer with metallopeptidase domain